MNKEQKKALMSMRNVKGQIEGIIKMIEDERYCLDISNQIIAAQGHLKRTNIIILKQHIEHCIRQAINNDNGYEKKEEIIDIMEKIIQDKF